MSLFIKTFYLATSFFHILTLLRFMKKKVSLKKNEKFLWGFSIFWIYLALNVANQYFRNDFIAATFIMLVNFLALIIYQYTLRHLKNDRLQADVVCDLAKIFICLNIVVVSKQLIIITLGILFLFGNLYQVFSYYKPQKLKGISLSENYYGYILFTGTLLVLSTVSLLFCQIYTIDNIVFLYSTSTDKFALFASFLFLLSCVSLSLPLFNYAWIAKLTDAPTSMSMLLHAGAINLGCYLVLSLFCYNTPSMMSLWFVFCFALIGIGYSKFNMTKEIAFKNKLAHSTITQMGFCLIEICLGFYILAVFHLIGHALYKAYLFSTNGNHYVFNKSNYVFNWGTKTIALFLLWLNTFAVLYHLTYGGSWLASFSNLPNFVASMVVTYMFVCGQFYNLQAYIKYGLITLVILIYQIAEWVNHIHFLRADEGDMASMQSLTLLAFIIFYCLSQRNLAKKT